MQIDSDWYRDHYGELLQASPEFFANEVFGYEVQPHHQAIIDHYLTCRETLDLAPRGSGKSRIGDIGYGAWRAVINPDIRILIVSDTDDHAKGFLVTIKTAIEQSRAIVQNFGDLRGDPWTDHAITLKGRTRIYTEPTIAAHGAYSGSVTSGHYDIIICDDLCNFDNTRTEGRRERMKEWFRMTLMPTLIPGGEIHVLGTRYHHLDLYQELIDNLGFDVQTQKAIQTEDGTERSIWEAYMPLHDRGQVKGLVKIRETIGTLFFALQYQNDVDLMRKGDIFSYDWFRWYELWQEGEHATIVAGDQRIPVNELQVFMGVDPAVSEKDRADWFAVVVIGFHKKTGNYFVLDTYRAHLSYADRAAIVDTKHRQWKPRITGIEDVAFQKEFIQRIQVTYPYIRIKGITTVKDKTSRAFGRSGLVQNGKVWVRKGMELFVEELCLMPDGEHDDLFDAWDMAMQAASVPQGGFMVTKIPGHDKYTRTR